MRATLYTKSAFWRETDRIRFKEQTKETFIWENVTNNRCSYT